MSGFFNGIDFSSSDALISKLRTFYPSVGYDETGLEKILMMYVRAHPDQFSVNLKRLRKEKGYSQADFAALLNVAANTYSTWETGDHSPRLESVKNIIGILQIDPSDLVSVNAPAKRDKSSVPILTPVFFSKLIASDLARAIELAPDLPCIRVPEGERFDFAFRVEDTDMIGEKKAIAPGSILLCQTRSFKDCITAEQRYKAADAHLAVVNFMGMEGMVREIHFFDNVLALVPWDPNAKLMAFPTDLKFADRVRPREAMKYLGYDLLAGDVEIFGIVEKSVQEFT